MIRGIIVEGIDCGGKSTLIQNLKFRLKNIVGYDVKSLGHRNCISQYRRYLYEYAANDKIIFDRAHFSEVVFGKILRNENPFSVAELKILNEIVELEFIIILAIPRYVDFCERIQQTKHIQVIEEKDYSNINTGFIKALSNIDYIVYKSESFDELDRITEIILQLLQRA